MKIFFSGRLSIFTRIFFQGYKRARPAKTKSTNLDFLRILFPRTLNEIKKKKNFSKDQQLRIFSEVLL